MLVVIFRGDHNILNHVILAHSSLWLHLLSGHDVDVNKLRE